MIKRLLKLNIGIYFLVSCAVSVMDFAVSYLLYKEMKLNYLAACGTGIITGFIFQYFYCMRYVFKKQNYLWSAGIFLLTFIFGLGLANAALWVSYNLAHFHFALSKIISMGVPFFITYFIRRRLLGVRSPEEVLD